MSSQRQHQPIVDSVDWSRIDFEKFTINPADAAPRSVPASNVARLTRIPHGTDPTLPWDRIPQASPDEGTRGIASNPTPSRRAALDKAVAVYRRGLAARIFHAGLDQPGTRAVAVRLADLLATAGELKESFDVYRSVVEQSLGMSDDIVRRAARHAAAVITSSDQVHDRIDLPQPIPRSIDELAADTRARADVVDEVTSDARQAMDQVDDFVAVLRRWQRISTGRHDDRTVSALAETVVENSAAARLRITESAAFDDPLPISKLLEALLDSEHNLRHRAVAYYRGRRHRLRFADMMIIQSPLSEGTRSEHLDAVLGERFGPAREATIRDVLYLTGSAPEVSPVVLSSWTGELGLTDRDIVINCPYLLRTRSDDHSSLLTERPEAPAPWGLLSGVAVTSLAGGGAADAAAILARAWGWGFAAAVRTKLEGYPHSSEPFGDWSDPPTDHHRQAELADDVINDSSSLLDALPHLTQRVCALDHPVGAIHALNARPKRRTPSPMAIVMIRISRRRIRWVARHLLTQGGKNHANLREVGRRAAELSHTQDALLTAVTRHVDTSPVLIVDLIDHLEDGYAESSAPTDPVDEDFDSYYDTAQRVRETLQSMLTSHPWAGALRPVRSGRP
jgi:hypothetical protein